MDNGVLYWNILAIRKIETFITISYSNRYLIVFDIPYKLSPTLVASEDFLVKIITEKVAQKIKHLQLDFNRRQCCSIGVSTVKVELWTDYLETVNFFKNHYAFAG